MQKDVTRVRTAFNQLSRYAKTQIHLEKTKKELMLVTHSQARLRCFQGLARQAWASKRASQFRRDLMRKLARLILRELACFSSREVSLRVKFHETQDSRNRS